MKIIDFGFAISSKEKLRVFCGTPSYMAPEIAAKKEYNGSATDVWSAGVVMYAILTGFLPFKSTDEKGLYRKIQAGVYSVPQNDKGERSSVEARDLLRSLLCVEPGSRITAENALLHPWITKNFVHNNQANWIN